MARIAVIGRVGVIAGFTLSNGIVVTANTATQYLAMIQWANERQPTVWCGIVAGFT